MKYLDSTLPSPAENLACDEALLEHCESTGADELLRFWEPSDYFVVVGYANHVAKEVDPAACAARSVPIFRRCSGGGTVLQGPGCLNYALVLRIEPGGPLHSIPAANRFIMERNCAAITAEFKTQSSRFKVQGSESQISNLQSQIHIRGHTDLAMGELKFSGNSQRRRKRYLLFHGTFLLHFDLELIGELLRFPSRQPTYRHNRAHRDFLMNLGLEATQVKSALQAAWNATEPMTGFSEETISLLARSKYETSAWNLRF